MLTDHELSCADNLQQAERLLCERPFDLIVCTVFFDESRMFDLLRFAKSEVEWAQIPFVCVRLRRHVLDAAIAREGLAFTCQALGAAYLDVADYGTDPEPEMRAAIERLLPTAPREHG
jgi:hypothetical protein